MSPARQTVIRGKSSAVTKQALLSAARERFLQESYENVGLRDIARDAGVDVALVNRYFGSKEELFREVVGIESREEILPAGLSNADISAFLAQMFLEREGADGNEHVERLLIILRSASSPAASAIVRETLRKDVLEPLAARLGGSEPELRASTVMAVWMGMTIMQTIMSVEPLCDGGCELQDRLRQLFGAALA